MQTAKTKRYSPVFWCLIALVLYKSVPLLLMFVVTVFNYSHTVSAAYFAGELTSLPTQAGFGYGTVFWLGLMPLLTLLASVLAMLCLIFRKYNMARKLLVFVPIGLMLTFILVSRMYSMEFNADILKAILISAFVSGVLFLYARKYHRLESAGLVA